MSRTSRIPANAPSAGRPVLLATKLQPPQVDAQGLVSRASLTAQLDRDLPVTIITAPSGSGKTTLLVEWIASRARTVAWLKLDELDNDLARFLTYLYAAVSDDPPPDSPSDALAPVIDALSALPLVIDDYHVISNAAIHETVAFLIEHLPAGARLILAGRTRPPLPLARLRANGQLLEIDDLRFTLEDTAALLRLSSDDPRAATYAVRTDGWIAGLRLAALWEQGGASPDSFDGSYRHVYDYFYEEVFEPQTSAVQSFLLVTAVLDQLTADACNALTGHDDGQVMLERLEQLNLFVVPLDGQRRAYCYHPLFREFLLACLAKRRNVADLHLRASAYYERAGHFANAVEHALQAKAFDYAADLVERLTLGGVDARDWLPQLPDDLIRSRPVLLALADTSNTFPVEPLSEREVEVLTLISTGLSNPEIAGRLIIAVSTVKTHVKNIFRKLDVDTRYEAMQRARELNLLQIRMESEYRNLIK